MANLLRRLSNPILMQIMKFIGVEQRRFLFRAQPDSLINMFCVCKTWYARFDYKDLNLWQLFAFDLEVDIDLKCTNDHRKRLLKGKSFTQKQLAKLVETIHTTTNEVGNHSFRVNLVLSLNELEPLVSAMRTCAASFPIKERQLVAEAAVSMVKQFASCESEEVRCRLVAFPGLMASMASLCGEEALLRNSQQLALDVAYIAVAFFCVGSVEASILVEAGWPNLLVRALRASHDDEEAVYWASWAIYGLLRYHTAVCRPSFIASEVVAALMDALDRHPTYNVVKNYKIFCNEALRILRNDL